MNTLIATGTSDTILTPILNRFKLGKSGFCGIFNEREESRIVQKTLFDKTVINVFNEDIFNKIQSVIKEENKKISLKKGSYGKYNF